MHTSERLWAIGKETVLGAPQLYVDVDVEADGIAGHGSMLSIGAQSPTGESFYSEVKPYSNDYIASNKAFCEKHGLERERLLDEAPNLQDVMEHYQDWLGQLTKKTGKKAVFTAFNAGFDWAHVDLAFTKTGYKNQHGVAPFDSKSLVLPLVGWDWSRTTKDHLPPEIIPREKFTHHALKDAQWQQKIHFGAAALLGTRYRQIITKTS